MSRFDAESPTCQYCGYSLRGLDGTRCPECGEEDALHNPARDARARLGEVIFFSLGGCALACISLWIFAHSYDAAESIVISSVVEGLAVAFCLVALRRAEARRRLAPIVSLLFVMVVFWYFVLIGLSIH